MKKRLTLIMLVVLCFLSIFVINTNKTVEAKDNFSTSPYTTQIIGLDGKLVNSSTAYLGVDVLNPEGLDTPSDIFIDENDIVYIADKGNGRILVYNHETKETREIGKGVLAAPTGVYVSNNDEIFVADSSNEKVYIFNQTGEKVLEIGRPIEALYGSAGSPNTQENEKDEEEKEEKVDENVTYYVPTKVAVDSADNIYIISQGNANGIIQMKLKRNENGSFIYETYIDENGEEQTKPPYEFLGYFGPNKVNVTLALLFKRAFMSEEDKEVYASLNAKATTNIAIDNRNTVYSVIEKEATLSMKKFNVNGINILTGNAFYTPTYKDIWVDDNGFIYTVDNEKAGSVSVIDPEGNLLFKFGNTITGNSLSLGQFERASGIAVDSKGNIWVADASNSIQVFMRTAYANTVMNALLNYNEGEYDRAVKLYNEVLEMNSSFVQAYVGLGKIAQRNQQYDEALEYFKIADYKVGYSEVFWELRDDWLGKNLIWVAGLLIILLILKIFHVYGKAYDKLMPLKAKQTVTKVKGSRLMGELKYLGHILKHPYDTFYDIKFGQKIRFKTALGIFVFFIAMNIFCDYFLTAYLFRPGSVDNFNLGFELLKWGLIIVLFVISNFLISSLQNGEGFFRDVFIATVYCFAPLILFKIPLAIVTNVLSYNEQYLVTLANIVLWGVSLLYVVLMIRDIHNYKLGSLILNIILTAVAMIVMVLIYLMVYILSMQLIDFVFGLIKEAMYIYG